MALLWTDDLATKHETLDDQHKQLFIEMNDLAESVKAPDRAGPLRRFERLGKLLRGHFANEEGLMQASRYPAVENHLRQHRAFMREYDGLQSTFAAQGATTAVVNKLNSWLATWLWTHIRGSDQDLGKHLRLQQPTPTRAA